MSIESFPKLTTPGRLSYQRPVPALPNRCLKQLLQAVEKNRAQLLSTWEAMTAAGGQWDSKTREGARTALLYLLTHLQLVTADEARAIDETLHCFRKTALGNSTAAILLVLSDFEEMILSIARSHLPAEDFETVYHWLHVYCVNLMQMFIEASSDQALDEKQQFPTHHQTSRMHRTMLAVEVQKLLLFDEHLFLTHDVHEVFQTLVTDSCQLAGFKRSALFLYNPLNQSVEGLFGHHVELDVIRRIRENGYRVPLLNRLLQLDRPVFLEDVSNLLPVQHVQSFHLTSLLICPVRGPASETLGVLLLDHNGQRFPHVPSQLELVKGMLDRVSFALSSHLHQDQERIPNHSFALTERELDVLYLLADGLDTKHTAEQLHISEYTVSEHITSILRKLKVKNRTAAVAKSLREGLIR
ncbi:LuxR C-terminal-related transcriptional regulator [Alicyclobacillus tolerans]|uniref:DNA-binding CsgD family transcriptional regulator n=1 Tax=Alicyclobacillus tolerans TaxID=90970 RepID=A0ABT9LZ31_9BACL|nr:LuxR C-terminal-related transcriptional regulator [Alicyclobacillus tengchongensis]MDP9729540.1 DNA-binding CsgD family transcriptional regulator [Alicyclobacillus tengchongensis]